MSAAGVVADHAAERATAMRRWIGAKCEVMHFRRVAQRIQDHARLDPRNTLYRIDFQNPVHVLREIENDRHVAALTREAGAGSPRQYRRSISAALPLRLRSHHRHREERRARSESGDSSKHRSRTTRDCRGRSGPRRESRASVPVRGRWPEGTHRSVWRAS